MDSRSICDHVVHGVELVGGKKDMEVVNGLQGLLGCIHIIEKFSLLVVIVHFRGDDLKQHTEIVLNKEAHPGRSKNTISASDPRV